MGIINRGDNKQDTWLTPPELIKELGEFDLDPCCPPVMPWETATVMYHYESEEDNGLRLPWEGRVWCNPPFSEITPWAEEMFVHGDGIMLVPAKSPETKWGQNVLKTGDAFLFLAGRIAFCYPDGTQSTGKWSPHMLVAYGYENVEVLRQVSLPGVLLARETRHQAIVARDGSHYHQPESVINLGMPR